MDLHQLIDQFALERDVSRGYIYQLHLVVGSFAKHIGRMPMVADLADDAVNRWLVALTESGLSKRTVKSKRSHLLALWRFGCEIGAVSALPARVRKVKCSKLIPDASPPEKVNELLAVARSLSGHFRKSRVSRPAFWVALLLVAWETGLRLGDLLKLERSWINATGQLTLTQSKSGWPIVCALSPECAAAIEATYPPERKRIFGDALSRGHVQKGMRRLLASVGLKGGTKRIRRSGATAVEKATPGGAMAYLGHQTHGLAYQFYVDPKLIQLDRPTPPPLTGSE